MRLLHFILSHSLFIACCAAALCYQTDILLHLPHDYNLYGFVFFSTLCSYNFYWLLSKFYFSGRKISAIFFQKQSSFLLVFATAAAGMLFFLSRLQNMLPYIAVGMLLTLIYSLPLWPFDFSKKLQRPGFFKTTLLSLSWAYVTVVLPAHALLNGTLMPLIALFSARFFFLLLLCIIFDMRDIAVDKMHGLHSLATDIGKNKLRVIIAFVFALYIAAGLAVRYYFHDDSQMIAFAFTGIIVWLVYRLSLKDQAYIFYYFFVDGLMLISAIFSFVADKI